MLIFSQWPEMLTIVSTALTRNGVLNLLVLAKTPADFGKGGKIDVFKTSPDVNVLLLPLFLGAEGLDLICANRILLLEPVLNAAQEIQAINRCHRLGQTRDTILTRYVIVDTIEERILAIQSNKRGGSDDAVVINQQPLEELYKKRHSNKKAKKGDWSTSTDNTSDNLSLSELQSILDHDDADAA